MDPARAKRATDDVITGVKLDLPFSSSFNSFPNKSSGEGFMVDRPIQQEC